MPQGIKATVDENQLEILAYLGASTEEMGRFFGVTGSCIRRRFHRIVQKGAARGEAELRRWQWEAAKKGNPALLIFLGKQRLGQSDKLEQKQEHSGPGGTPLLGPMTVRIVDTTAKPALQITDQTHP